MGYIVSKGASFVKSMDPQIAQVDNGRNFTLFLTLSQTSPGFYVSAVQVF